MGAGLDWLWFRLGSARLQSDVGLGGWRRWGQRLTEHGNGVLSASAIQERIPDLICQEILAFWGWSCLIQPRIFFSLYKSFLLSHMVYHSNSPLFLLIAPGDGWDRVCNLLSYYFVSCLLFLFFNYFFLFLFTVYTFSWREGQSWSLFVCVWVHLLEE